MADIPIALYALVLGGTLFHTASNIGQKFLLNKKVHEELVMVVTAAGAALVGFIGSFIIYGLPTIQPKFWIPFGITVTTSVGIVYFGVKSKKLEDLSIVAPLASATPMFLILMSWVILRESPSAWGRVGMGLIGIGAYILYLKGAPVPLPKRVTNFLPASWHESVSYWFGPWLRLFSSRGARFALTQAWLGAIAISFDKLVVLNSNPFFRTGAIFAATAICLFVFSFGRGEWQRISKDNGILWRLLLVGMAIGIADVLYSFGFYHGFAAYVGSLKRVQILWTIVLAWLILKEGYVGQRLAGSIVIIAGAVLLSF